MLMSFSANTLREREDEQNQLPDEMKPQIIYPHSI
jgi:hypothetical protein